jgi:hypothetical protein
MAESPNKVSDKKASDRNNLQCAALAGAFALSAMGGVFMLDHSVFYLGQNQYADVDGGSRRVTGQGIHVVKSLDVQKFSRGKETITLTEPEATVDMDVAYAAPEKLEPIFGSAMGLAEERLQDAFRKNAWTYADAKAVCAVLAQGVEEGLDGYLRNPKVTGCRIKLTPSA